MAMASGLPPVSEEQAFLETYFQCLSKSAYDKAKEQSERQRENSKSQSSTAWGLLVNSLVNLAIAEKAYTSLHFLGQNLAIKFFGRKEPLKTSYGYLLTDLRRIDEAGHQRAAGSPTTQSSEERYLENLLAHLSGQLCQYIMARTKIMEFYEQMLAMSQNRGMMYEDLFIVITDIVQNHHKNFHHPILSPLKSSFNLECDIITHLLQSQLQLQQWQFLPALLQLNEAHTKLNSWGALLLTKEGKKLGFGSSSKSGSGVALYQWLVKFKALLVAKFGLYFYEILSKQAPSTGEVKSLMSKSAVDFYGKIVTFQKKSDAANILLIFDVTGIEDTFKGPGYHHPQKATEHPRGLDSYPAIFSYPAERPDKHWPSIISIMTSRISDLHWDKTIYFYDEKLQWTYFMSRVEQRITFVVIFESRKAEKDTYINNFVSDICSQLRCTKLMAALKPGGK